MSGELENVGAEDNLAQTSNAIGQRSRGLMLQQSMDRPSEHLMRVTQGNNMASSVATSAMTSPKLHHRPGDSVNASNSKRTSQGGGSTQMVHETGDNLS